MTISVPMVAIPSGPTRLLGSGEAGKQPLPLQGVQRRARVIDRVAEVTVEQKFVNPFSEPIEAVYVFPLAGGSAVSGFEMQIGGGGGRGRVPARAATRARSTRALGRGGRAGRLEYVCAFALTR